MVVRAGDPIFSMIVTPGVTKWFSQADFSGSPKRVRISSLALFSKVIVISDLADNPLWLDLWSSIDSPGFLWEEPVRYRYSVDNSKNIFEFAQPIRTDTLDISFRITAPYPGGTVKDPTASTVSIGVVYT
jgi:hypothetical protein